jgi:hypothetical protein
MVMEENNKKKEVILRKIALQKFIETLVDVYNSGADYVDIVGTPDENQDTIGIVVHEEYLSKDDMQIEFISDEDDEEEEYIEPNDKPLSDEDINDLI